MTTSLANAEFLRRLDRYVLTKFLERCRDWLSPSGAALLARDGELDLEAWCGAWGAEFKAAGAFGAPLRQALEAVERLALPENEALLREAISHLPPGFEINCRFPPLHQAIHLWVIAHGRPDVAFPIQVGNQAPANSGSGNKVVERPTGCCGEQGDPRACAAEGNRPDGDEGGPTANPGGRVAAAATPSGEEAVSTPAPGPQGSDFMRLAGLPPAEYDRARKAEAKRLCLRLATLDEEVERCREQIDEAEADRVFLPVPEPWPEPISDAAALYDSVHDRFEAYVHLPPGAAVVLAMFLGHVHGFGAFHYTPRINILSDRETCGKSTTVKVLASMAPKPFRVHNLRPAVVYRIIDKRQPTVLLDEIETFLPLYRELLGLLNAGNSSDACVPRCEGGRVHVYKAFSPVVLAGIGDLFRTLRSRSILVPMSEAPEGAGLSRFDSEHLEIEEVLARKLARWAADNLKAIAACDPPLPPGARNRVADNWRPLFQIAQVARGRWPERVARAYEQLQAATARAKMEQQRAAGNREWESEAFIRAELIPDIRRVFEELSVERIFSRDLVDELSVLPEGRWQQRFELWPEPERWIARGLRRCGIRPRILKIDGKVGRGYVRSDFEGKAAGREGEARGGFDPGI